MRRIHFFEIEDQSWCPAPIRRAATDYLRVAAKLNRVYEGAVPLMRRAIERAGADRVLDLCSGSGGPWIDLRSALADAGLPVRVVLTDFHPNVVAFEHVRAFANELGDCGYSWDVGQAPIPKAPVSMTYLIGVPEAGSTAGRSA